ncbi:hypothetical protein UG55_100932 [Frankia sp. EI5c]|uniref:hypothetical protein n=1 Tax=Frankia sp. EI5c TaxID=683316 RepID=UPI0007C32937|nr:hypothetical protein [Frankia sp. EI5c]OAA27149.1 hypothetical protein UG55_100932 [Frankia sp. EI5c]
MRSDRGFPVNGKATVGVRRAGRIASAAGGLGVSGRHSARRRAAHRPRPRQVEHAYREFRGHVADRACLADRVQVSDRRSALLATTASLMTIALAFGMLGLMAFGSTA